MTTPLSLSVVKVASSIAPAVLHMATRGLRGAQGATALLLSYFQHLTYGQQQLTLASHGRGPGVRFRGRGRGGGGFFRGRSDPAAGPSLARSLTYVELGGVEDVASVGAPARAQQTDRALVNLTVPVRLLQRPHLSKERSVKREAC